MSKVAPEPASQPAQPFEHEGDVEYQNGLAALLSMAPLLGPKLITSAFRVGYRTGLQEAGHFQASVDGDTGVL